MDQKTNVMRYLDKLNISYKIHAYTETNAIGGMDVAFALNKNPSQVFKTLVTIGKSKKYYVFMIPVNRELDLKKAAASVDEKSVEMIKSKDLLQLTGYIHGGCSPLCMKRPLKTMIDSSVESQKTIFFSAGKVGYQIEIEFTDLQKAMDIKMTALVM